ncbi:hypothetical protein PVK06_036531 [Gossypium arboreum]|uniref:Uncharacterized protein n=1 Tax=Gossypium arboreum TaxID=29729 RepID=A0ABR0NMY0_GOSAR|nr:hypothetical protein PVK06_036531 [Gossypium arboreum]
MVNETREGLCVNGERDNSLNALFWERKIGGGYAESSGEFRQPLDVVELVGTWHLAGRCYKGKFNVDLRSVELDKGLEACADFVNNKEIEAGGFHDEEIDRVNGSQLGTIMDIEVVGMGGEALAEYNDLTPKTNPVEIKNKLDGGILVSLEDVGKEG